MIIHLELNNVSKRFGGNQAVDHVSFTVTKPELIGMIGPNGAGQNHADQSDERHAQAEQRHDLSQWQGALTGTRL